MCCTSKPALTLCDPRTYVTLSITCQMFCLKSNPALPWPVPDHGPPNPIAGELIVIAGPVPESALATELWWRCAYCARNSLSRFDPNVETTWAAAESIASRKSVCRSSVSVPAPVLYGASLWNWTQRAVTRLLLFSW